MEGTVTMEVLWFQNSKESRRIRLDRGKPLQLFRERNFLG
jgi:hypothetical protein